VGSGSKDLFSRDANGKRDRRGGQFRCGESAAKISSRRIFDRFWLA